MPLFLGFLLAPFIARALPFGLDGRVAAFIMQADRWHAGAALMETGSPEGWRIMVGDLNLVNAYQAALALCREVAAKAKKEQRCTFVVPAP